jgi:hypothetical protein
MPVGNRRCVAKERITLLVGGAVMRVWNVCSKNPPGRQLSQVKQAWSESTASRNEAMLILRYRRIRSLEAHVADIRVTQSAIQNTLLEIVSHLRGTAPYNNRSPSTFSQAQYTQSPTIQSIGSPPVSACPNGSHVGDSNIHGGPATPTAYQTGHGSIPPMLNPPSRHIRSSGSQGSVMSSGQAGIGDFHPPQLPPSYMNSTGSQQYAFASPSSGAILPPFSTIVGMGAGNAPGHPSIRYSVDNSQRSHGSRNYNAPTPSGSKRTLPPSSNVTSADSSDVDDEDNGELPASGLVAPWEVLRGLADVAIERAAKVSVRTIPTDHVLQA